MNVLQKLTALENEAADFGFKWEKAEQILVQIKSECVEVEAHLKHPNLKELEEEMGDLLHAAFSLCVFLQLDPQITLEKSVAKFERRFRKVQELASKQGLKNLKDHSFSELMQLWDTAKQQTNE